MIKISEPAAKHLAYLKSMEGKSPEVPLRVKVKKGGCSGLSYKMDFDSESLEGDKVFTENGQTIVVDKESLLYLLGMTLDFSGGLNGKGFVFNNPNATKKCSCGVSFNV